MNKLILFLSLILSAGIVSAQSEIPSDSIRRTPSANVKEFGGFLLDMGIMNITAPQLPKTDLSIPNVTKDYNQLFRMNTDAIYSQGFTDTFSPSYSGFGYEYNWGFYSSPQFMQMGSFKLKNGIVTKRSWIAKEDFIDLLAISQSAPGIQINPHFLTQTIQQFKTSFFTCRC